ncbi:MAG: alpha-glucosidase/alpha-galactosidase [Candidatus Lutibacillus vidarii]|nr:alpha-glucosidase/alpha-galactosidase [Dermatophilaceae bacterium]
MTRICFVGAGSVVFTTQLLRDLLSYDDLGELHIALHDIDADRLETARLTAEQVARRLGRPVGLSAHTDRRAALEGVDVAITMIQVGGLAATKIDFEVPARFGLRQTIGDTLGVGGVYRALRTFPVLRDIAADMAAVCPDAWLLNYTNPMAMNVWWLAEVAPALRSVGLCHSVYWTVDGLCDIIGVPVAEVDYRAAGVNHQAWLLQWQRNGEDLYPMLRERIAADEQLRRRVRVDLFQRLGYYPTETSEHSSEYVPWYLHHDEEIARLRIPVGDYVQISEDNVRQYEAARATLAAGGELDLGDPEEVAEYAPQVIHSLVTGTQRTIHANVANRGLIDNLPVGAGVEVPATVDRLGVHPQAMGSLPPQCAALNRSFLNVAELTVRAALAEDRTMVRQAVMLDPNAAATLTLPQLDALCDELAAAHAAAGDYLPAWVR